MSATAAPYVQNILERFDNVRGTSTGWSARCPAHRDKKNSLSLGIGDDGQVLVHCHAGCETGMVLYHKGLQFKDLFPPKAERVQSNGAGQLRLAEALPAVAAYEEPLKPAARVIGTTRYAIRDPSGDIVAVHVRRDFDDGSKAMHWERPDGTKGLGGTRVESLPLYGIHMLGASPTVILVEGEKPAQALRDIGAPAVATVTGASGCPSDDSLRPLVGRTVILWPDNDDAGARHMDRVAEHLSTLGIKPNKLFQLGWPDAPLKGDAADFVARGGGRDELNALLNDCASPWQLGPVQTQPATSAAAGVSLGREPSQATKLATMVHNSDAELFHDSSGDAYITVTVGDHRETYLLRSRAAREWLRHAFYAKEERAPNGTALRDAIEQLSADATFGGACRSVHVRRAGDDDAIYLDLGDDAWQVAHVTANGWRIVPASDVPVRFRRPSGMLALPVPVAGGTMQRLRPLVNVASDDAFALVVAWLLGTLRPRGPYPVLALSGEQGAAKSTLARTLRLLIDPNVAPLRTTPREEADLLIAAKHGLVCCFDNVSSLSDTLSDALCRLATGGGLGKRTLYTDSDETLLDATRPVLLTGIESALTRGDAIDRALLVELERIPKSRRRTESEIDAELDAMRPSVLGALLTAASAALAHWSTTRPENLPRMADFGRWIESGASALGWQPGSFLSIYDTNRDEADELVVESEPIGPPLRAFIDARSTWTGTADELLTALNEVAGDQATKRKEWPKAARGIAGRVKRIAPNLLRLGYTIETGRREGHAGRRLMTLGSPESGKDRQHCQHRQQPRGYGDFVPTVAENQSSATDIQSTAENGADDGPPIADGWLTVAEHQSSAEKSRHDADFEGIWGGADDADDCSPHFSQGALFDSEAASLTFDDGLAVSTGQRHCSDADRLA
jgi:hypothetical protein